MIKISLTVALVLTSNSVFSQISETKPATMLCPPIPYPKLSKKIEEEGTVQLLIKVKKDGTIGDIVVERSSQFRRLDSAAVELIPNCQITPAFKDSVAYDSLVRQRFTFRLEGGNSKPKVNASSNNALNQNAAEEEQLKIQRLRKMAEVVSATNEPQAFSYAERIARKIKPNIVFVESTTGNPTAIVEIKSTEDGKIIGVRLAESSSNKSWDEAVLKAVVKSESIPLDSNGKIPNTLLISFRPKD